MFIGNCALMYFCDLISCLVVLLLGVFRFGYGFSLSVDFACLLCLFL